VVARVRAQQLLGVVAAAAAEAGRRPAQVVDRLEEQVGAQADAVGPVLRPAAPAELEQVGRSGGQREAPSAK